MKRQKVLGFTGAMMVGTSLLLGACNKHSFEDGEFDKGVKKLYQEHHARGEADDHGKGHDSGHGDTHADPGKVAKAHGEKSDSHSKEAGEHKADEGKVHIKQAAAKKPAKSLFPKK